MRERNNNNRYHDLRVEIRGREMRLYLRLDKMGETGRVFVDGRAVLQTPQYILEKREEIYQGSNATLHFRHGQWSYKHCVLTPNLHNLLERVREDHALSIRDTIKRLEGRETSRAKRGRAQRENKT